MIEQEKIKKGKSDASKKRIRLFEKFKDEVDTRFSSGDKKMTIDRDLVKRGAPRFFVYYCLARLGKLDELVKSNREKIMKQISVDTGEPIPIQVGTSKPIRKAKSKKSTTKE